MTHCNSLNVKLSNSQLIKSKWAIKKKKNWINSNTFMKYDY